MLVVTDFSTCKDQVFLKSSSPDEHLSHVEFPATSHNAKKQCDITRGHLDDETWLNDGVSYMLL